MNTRWNLKKEENEIIIQQDDPYAEVLVGFIRKEFKPNERYFEVKLSDAPFELNLEINYFLSDSFQLFHTEKQCWKYFELAIYFILDKLYGGTYGVIRILKISRVEEETLKQDKIVQDWIDRRIFARK